MLLWNVNYGHWLDEHLVGHHHHVATPEDPATSRLNESLYAFLPRTLYGSFMSSWNIEKKRLESQGKGMVHNRIYWGLLLPAVWACVLARRTRNWKVIPVFYAQGFAASCLLELVNYTEHYGLLRAQTGVDSDGNNKYEPVNPTHSWNAPHKLSNAVLFKLQRHSDHHTYASRPYEVLRNFKESPQLPTGYPGMLRG